MVSTALPSKNWLRPLRNPIFWLKVDLLIIFTLMLSSLDPFGWKSAPEQSAEQFIQKFTSPFKPHKNNDLITVILIDPNYYTSAKPLWPLPSKEFNLNIVRNIIKHKPKALFLDISYPDAPREVKSGGSNTRQQALLELSKGLNKYAKNTPIFIGDSITDVTSTCSIDRSYHLNDFETTKTALLKHNILNDLFLTKTFAQQTSVTYDKGVHIVDVGVDLGAQHYTLASCGLGKVIGYPEYYFASPALALYKAYTETQVKTHPPASADYWENVSSIPNKTFWPMLTSNHLLPKPKQSRQLHKQWRFLTEDDHPSFPHWLNAYTTVSYQAENSHARLIPENKIKLSTQWDFYQPRTMQIIHDAIGVPSGCNAKLVPNNVGSRFYDSFISYVQSLGINLNNKPNCVAFNNFSAFFLGDIRRVLANENEQNKIDTRTLSQFVKNSIKDKIVLVGTNLTQTKDITYSPVNDYIPGVFLHATALKNLIDQDSQYVHKTSHVSSWASTAFLVFLLTYLSEVYSTFSLNKQSPLFIGVVIGGGILIPWLAIWMLSVTNLPLALGLLSALIALIESVKDKINGLENYTQVTALLKKNITKP